MFFGTFNENQFTTAFNSVWRWWNSIPDKRKIMKRTVFFYDQFRKNEESKWHVNNTNGQTTVYLDPPVLCIRFKFELGGTSTCEQGFGNALHLKDGKDGTYYDIQGCLPNNNGYIKSDCFYKNLKMEADKKAELKGLFP